MQIEYPFEDVIPSIEYKTKIDNSFKTAKLH